MADAESLRQTAQSRAPFSTWLGVVLLFALFGAIVLAVIGPASRSDDYEQKRAKAREEKLKTAREEDAKALSSYGWIDKNKGVARIPVARAMELTLVELAQKKPEPAGPIATPEPAAPGAATGAPAPPAAPTPASSGSPAPAQPPPGSPTPVPAKTP
jgi:hypothetical protein